MIELISATLVPNTITAPTASIEPKSRIIGTSERCSTRKPMHAATTASTSAGPSRANVRSIDAVIRYGGDEFLVVLLESDEEGAKKAAHRIRQRVMEALESSPAVPTEARIRVSMGYAVRRPGENVDEKLADADHRMYLDKNGPGGLAEESAGA